MGSFFDFLKTKLVGEQQGLGNFSYIGDFCNKHSVFMGTYKHDG